MIICHTVVMGLCQRATLRAGVLIVLTRYTKWHSTGATHAIVPVGTSAAKNGSHWTCWSLPTQPLLERQNNIHSLFSSVYVDFCYKKRKKKTTTIWWQPDCLPTDAVLIFTPGLLYVSEVMADWISSKRSHTQTRTSTPSVVCSHAVSHLCVFWELNR